MAKKGLLLGVAQRAISRARATQPTEMARKPIATAAPAVMPRKPVAAAPADRMARLARITTGKPRGRMK
jgi:hypothetical protein